MLCVNLLDGYSYLLRFVACSFLLAFCWPYLWNVEQKIGRGSKPRRGRIKRNPSLELPCFVDVERGYLLVFWIRRKRMLDQCLTMGLYISSKCGVVDTRKDKKIIFSARISGRSLCHVMFIELIKIFLPLPWKKKRLSRTIIQRNASTYLSWNSPLCTKLKMYLSIFHS